MNEIKEIDQNNACSACSILHDNSNHTNLCWGRLGARILTPRNEHDNMTATAPRGRKEYSQNNNE